MKRARRILAFAMMICLLCVCICPTEALAAANYKGKTQRFLIRRSGSYASTGVWVTMKSTSTDGKTGTITFEDTLELTWLGKNVKIHDGVVYTYKISSLKENSKITLTWKISNGGPLLETTQLWSITAKIHIDKNKGCNIANIWKIDSLKYGSLGLSGIKVYFRNN